MNIVSIRNRMYDVRVMTTELKQYDVGNSCEEERIRVLEIYNGIWPEGAELATPANQGFKSLGSRLTEQWEKFWAFDRCASQKTAQATET